MVAEDHEDPDAGCVQLPEFLGEEDGAFRAGDFAVVRISGNEQCVRLEFEAKVDNLPERSARGNRNDVGKLGILECQASQRRIEMQVSRMNELEGHRHQVS